MNDSTTTKTSHETSESQFVWKVEGKPISVRLDQDALNRLTREVMRGFGIVPKRSIEVGGILLGRAEQEPDGTWSVVIEDFEPVVCRHKAGPAFLLQGEEYARFSEILTPWKHAEGRRIYAVGFYRSHVRDGFGMTPEDLKVFNEQFPAEWAVTLLVKPFATRPSIGAFFFREGGEVNPEPVNHEFPMKLKEAVPMPALQEEIVRNLPPDPVAEQMQDQRIPPPSSAIPAKGRPAPAYDVESKSTVNRVKARELKWVWIPLSVVFLLLGLAMGAFVALSFKNPVQASAPLSAPPSDKLSLMARTTEKGIHVQWDLASRPIQQAVAGKLIIDDNGRQKTENLEPGLLKNGSILYSGKGEYVSFRLEVYGPSGNPSIEALTVGNRAAGTEN